jgi:hypothetical protein
MSRQLMAGVRSSFTPNLEGLISYYKMEDNAANTTIVDYMGNNNATIVNGTADIMSVVGKVNNGLYFDLPQYAIIGNPASLDFQPMDSFSMGGWVSVEWINPRWNSTTSSWISSTGSFIGRGTGLNSVGIGVQSIWENTGDINIPPNLIETRIQAGSRATVERLNSRVPIDLNIFYHVVFVYTAGLQYLYVNGVLANTQTNGFDGSFSGNWNIMAVVGIPGGNTERISGKADELFIVNRALTAHEITSIYNGGLGTTIL